MKRIRRNPYYVYVLFRPWNGLPFYVGKGKNNRWLKHERRGEDHSNQHIARILSRAKQLGLEIPKVKIKEFLTQKEAFSAEIAFIKAIGRGKNRLANQTDGGDGIQNMSIESFQRRNIGIRKAAKRRYKDPKERERQSRISRIREAKLKEQGFKRTFPPISKRSKAKQAKKMKAWWAIPENKEKQIAKLKAGRKRTIWTPEKIAERGQLVRAGFTEAGRKRRRTKIIERWLDPEYRRKTIANLKITLNKPGIQEKRIRTLKANWTSERRDKRSSAMKKACSSPEARAKKSKAMKKVWKQRHAKRFKQQGT